MTRPRLDVILGGTGPIGLGLARLLLEQGRRVRVVSRSGTTTLPRGAEPFQADVSDAGATRRACEGAEAVYGCMGFDYGDWERLWPPIVEAMIEAAASAGARLVFADNLYGYGPVDGPMREELCGTRYGRKPALRARMTARLLEADASGRVRVAIGRASDFYGPGVTKSALGDQVFAPLLAGRPANLLGDPDQPHTFTYAPDFSRALVTLGQRDAALGQVWNVPNAPTLTTRAIVEKAFALAGRPTRMRSLPGWLLPVLGLVSPLMREFRELGYQFTRPFVVDHSKYAAAFGDDATPFETGLAATLEWYRSR